MNTWKQYAFVNPYGEILDIWAFSTPTAEVEAEIYRTRAFGEKCRMFDVTNYHLDVSSRYRYHDDAFWYLSEDEATGTETETKLEPVPSEEDRIEAVETTSATNTTSIDANTTAIDDILVMLLDDTTDTDATT